MGGRQLYVLGCGESFFTRQDSIHTMITETITEGPSSWLSNNPHSGSLPIEWLFLGTGFDDPPHPDCALSPWLCVTGDSNPWKIFLSAWQVSQGAWLKAWIQQLLLL